MRYKEDIISISLAFPLGSRLNHSFEKYVRETEKFFSSVTVLMGKKFIGLYERAFSAPF